MTKILAVDTSTHICSICAAEDDIVVAEYVSKSETTHTERLLPAIEFLFRQIHWEVQDLHAVAIIHGPGSFTGLRISLSTIKGLSFAFNLPVIPVSALEVAASQVPEDGYISPAMDARRQEIFTCLYERRSGELILHSNPVSVTPERWIESLPPAPVTFCGPGAALYWEQFQSKPGSRLAFRDFVLARDLAKIAQVRFRKGQTISGENLKAAYLRPSDAEVKGPKRK